jgi:hypothetical protein
MYFIVFGGALNFSVEGPSSSSLDEVLDSDLMRWSFASGSDVAVAVPAERVPLPPRLEAADAEAPDAAPWLLDEAGEAAVGAEEPRWSAW